MFNSSQQVQDRNMTRTRRGGLIQWSLMSHECHHGCWLRDARSSHSATLSLKPVLLFLQRSNHRPAPIIRCEWRCVCRASWVVADSMVNFETWQIGLLETWKNDHDATMPWFFKLQKVSTQLTQCQWGRRLGWDWRSTDLARKIPTAQGGLQHFPCKLSVCVPSKPTPWLTSPTLTLTLLCTPARFPISPFLQQVVIQAPPVDTNLRQIFWVTKNCMMTQIANEVELESISFNIPLNIEVRP